MFKNTISIQVEVKEAITFEDVDEIGIDQTNEYLGGWFQVWVELIQENRIPKDVIRGLNLDGNSIMVATKHEYDFKRGDLIRLYGHEEYKVKTVKMVIDPDFTNTIRMFPGAKRLYTWKLIELGI